MAKAFKKSLIMALLFLSSCEKTSFFPPVRLRSISFSATEDMNEGRVLIVHMVVPKDKELYDKLLQMDAQAYFSVCERLKTDYPNKLEVFTWEIVPGTTINDATVTFADFKAEGVIIFARYDDSIAGVHRLVLPYGKSARISLGRTECSVLY